MRTFRDHAWPLCTERSPLTRARQDVWKKNGIEKEKAVGRWEARGELAWSWWQKEGNKARYGETKVWRLIESLAGLVRHIRYIRYIRYIHWPGWCAHATRLP